MNETQRFLGFAILLNSVLYLGAVVASAVVAHNVPARDFAIIAFGFCFAAYEAQFQNLRMIAILTVGGSVFFGVLAGFALLFGG